MLLEPETVTISMSKLSQTDGDSHITWHVGPDFCELGPLAKEMYQIINETLK